MAANSLKKKMSNKYFYCIFLCLTIILKKKIKDKKKKQLIM